MRVLAIAPEPFFTPRGTPMSVYYRTAVMAERGAQVDLLTYGQGDDVDIANVRLIRIPRLRWLEPIKTGPSLTKALLDAWMVLWTVRLLLRRRYDLVHAHEESAFWCRLLKPLLRFKLVYDMHSSLPQQLTNFQFTRSRLLIGLFDRLERSSLHRSDAIITICPQLQQHVTAMNGCGARSILIENSLFEPVRLKSRAHPSTHEPDRAEPTVTLPPSPRLVYCGTLEAYQGIELLLEAFALLHQDHREASLLIVGGRADQVDRYQKYAADRNVQQHVLFTGSVSQARAQQYQRKADVLLSPRVRGDNTPLKIYELLASGIPFVATNIDAHTQVLSEDVCFLAPPEPEPFARAMKHALTDRPARQEKLETAKCLYEAQYGRRAYEQKIDRLLEMVS
jgi:glycosyltransferase involved in cell wall biosynthesis